MSREILFKAKRKDNGEWIQGYYYQIWQQGYICWRMINNMPDMVEVNPNTLCQYTGLTDKNGKKIWENDILRGHKNDDDLAKVVFGEFNVIDVYTLETVDRVVCSSAAVVVAITIAYFIGKLKGFKEVTEKDNKYREEFEQLVIDFITEKYERKKENENKTDTENP